MQHKWGFCTRVAPKGTQNCWLGGAISNDIIARPKWVWAAGHTIRHNNVGGGWGGDSLTLITHTYRHARGRKAAEHHGARGGERCGSG